MRPRIPLLVKTGIRFRLLFLVALSSLVMIACLFVIIRSISENKAEMELKENSNLLLFVLDWTVEPFLVDNDINTIQRLFEKIGTEPFIAHLRLFDPGFRILASNIPEEQGMVYPLEALSPLFSGKQLSFQEKSPNSYVSAVPVRGSIYSKEVQPGLGAVLYLEMDRKSYINSYRGFLYGTLLAFFGALLIISTLILISFNRWVDEPLKMLQKATYEVSKGNYNVDVRIIRPLEFEQFAEIFNRMINELKQKEMEISDYSYGLEEMVSARTDELADSINKLKQTQKRLIQQEKMASIGQLAAGVAHEINNPTGFVFSNLQTLEEYTNIFCTILEMKDRLLSECNNYFTPGQKKLYDEIEDYASKENLPGILSDLPSLLKDSKAGTYRISEIVKSLQSFARDDMGELIYDDINEAIESALKIVWNRIKYKCEVVKNLGELPRVPCSKNQLEQVFMNLLVNAGDAVYEKGIITIESMLAGDEVLIRISDNGTGISEEVQKSLFEPFFTTKEVGKGTGLGLPISRFIVENHHGSIEVESQLGIGTTFTVRLPLKVEVNE